MFPPQPRFASRDRCDEARSHPHGRFRRACHRFPLRGFGEAVEVRFNLGTATLEEVQQAMDAGALTSVEMAGLYLRRISLYDQAGAPAFNSVLALCPDVIEQARQADLLRAKGVKLGPLHGVPCLVKGSYSVKGLATAAVTTAWADLIAPEDCFLVAKLREAGAVIMGHANMDTWANSGQSSTSQLKGTVKNAYVLGTTAGGSSGGAGVAAAANFAFFTFGGETGASIRGPSDRTGLAGQRPTVGAMPSNHIVNLSPERDVVGPMTRNVGDLAYIRDAVSFEDPADPWAPILPLFQDGRPFPKGFSASLSTATLSGKKLGIVGTYVGLTHPNPGVGATTATTTVNPTKPEIFANFERSKAQLEAAGATVSYVYLPPQVSTTFDRGPGAPQRTLSSDPVRARFNANAHKEMIEFLVRTPTDTLDTLAAKVVAKAALPTGNTGIRTISDTTISYMYTFSQGVVTGSQALSFGSPQAAEHYTALRESRRALEAWMDAEDLDALVFPVDSGKTPTVGFVNGRDPINAMHIPGTVVPNGSLPDGEPTCLIFVGKGYEDVEVYKLAYAFEQVSQDRYSTPLAPPLPEESFTYSIKKPNGPNLNAPTVLTITGKPALTGTGSNEKIVLSGKILQGAELERVTLFVNGKRTPMVFTVAANGKDWSGTFPASTVRSIVASPGSVSISLESVDADGNTDVKFKTFSFTFTAKGS